MRSLKLAPTRALSPFVAYVRVTQAPEREPLPYLRLPDGQLELTLAMSRAGAREALRVVGTRLAPLRKASHPGPEFVTIRFRAGGAYPFFGVPLSVLTQHLTDLEDLWGDATRVLEHAVAQAPHLEGRVAALEAALCRRLAVAAFEPGSAPAVRRALRRVQASEALPRVEDLACAVGLSARQLRRGFLDVVGIGPKQYLRVVRFQRALAALKRAPDASLATIARAAGYFDQSHLHADFRALAGATPSALRPSNR